ncbi:unnamed protein product [Aureobasidium pullulans]|nr:unnamed protein product [Aureobasidium pullulans]
MVESPTAGRAILRKPKKIICALDGTWQDSDSGWVKGRWGQPGHLQNPSNVTRISRAIKPEDSEHHAQIVYYQAGIGTGLGIKDQLLGGGTGLGLSEHIREAYYFLANNYSPGDSIFLVGFSRGSFTARSLGGLIGNLGLLNKRGLPHFYEVFLDWTDAGNTESPGPSFWEHYRDPLEPEKRHIPQTPSNDPTKVYEYLDEYRASALGIPINPVLQKHLGLPSFLHEYKWLDTRLSDNIENAFQALALDEHRAPFSPAVWEKPTGNHTFLRQTWFPGAHSNVGGSYDDTSTADISLAWMMDQLSGESAKHANNMTLDKKDWIEFYDDYLDTQQELNRVWYQGHPPARGWSLGTIYNSFTFPQSLAGRVVRTPGRYRVTNSLTCAQKNDCVLMKDTHEFIHASVRARMDLGGTASEPEPSNWTRFVQWLRKLLGRDGRLLYRPESLQYWKLHDGHKHHNEFSINSRLTTGGADESVRAPWWEWIGKDALLPSGRVLNEDRLGRFELQLLGHHEDVAAEIEASNKGLASVEELRRVQERVARRSVTV